MGRRGALVGLLTGAGLLLLTPRPAVAAAPALEVFGAYFPAWIFCALLGVFGAVVVRAILAKLQIDEFLPAKLLVYLAFAVLIGVGVWKLWYAGGPA